MIVMQYENLKLLINNSTNIVFFGGAGVSTESSIPDFRSASGLYKTINNYSCKPEVMLSYSFFKEHPEDFFDFYRNNMIYAEAKPNAAHYALAKLEQQGKLRAVITQNIDGLHQLSGSKNVYELHGSVHRNYCTKCSKQYDLDFVMHSKDIIPRCKQCGCIVRPDVILYEEGLDTETLTKSISLIQKADLLIVGGTSLVVYPAAGLIQNYNGDKLVLINKSTTSYDTVANFVIHDSIGKVLSEVL